MRAHGKWNALVVCVVVVNVVLGFVVNFVVENVVVGNVVNVGGVESERVGTCACGMVGEAFESGTAGKRAFVVGGVGEGVAGEAARGVAFGVGSGVAGEVARGLGEKD